MQMMKFIGKPYAGKPHVRIDEGAGEAFCLLALLYCSEILRKVGQVQNPSAVVFKIFQ
jgi:hypothetical protein